MADESSVRQQSNFDMLSGGKERFLERSLMDLITQHCVAIAAAFIAAIAACANLITGANNKAESLERRIRDAASEHREPGDETRCKQIREQITLFKARYQKIQDAQRLLFLAIGIFITALTFFISIGLCLLAGGTTNVPVWSIVIGLCVLVGSICMLKAISLHSAEVAASYETLRIETRDCPEHAGPDPLKVGISQPTSHVIQAAPAPAIKVS